MGEGTESGSWRDQFGDADQIVSDEVEQEVGTDAMDAAMLGLPHGAVQLAPTKMHSIIARRNAVTCFFALGSEHLFRGAPLGRAVGLRHHSDELRSGAKQRSSAMSSLGLHVLRPVPPSAHGLRQPFSIVLVRLIDLHL